VLRELGFTHDTWGETITAFYNANNELVTVMPLGLKLSSPNECRLLGRVFQGSKLYDYILRHGVTKLRCIVCVTLDPQVFYKAVLMKDEVVKLFATLSQCPTICDACITGLGMFSVKEEAIEVSIDVLGTTIKGLPKVFTRAGAAIIEALVWLTKLSYVECDKLDEVMSWLNFLKIVVYRSSQNETYRKLINLIYAKSVEVGKIVESSRCRSRNKNI
jgi:hypothetical protein